MIKRDLSNTVLMFVILFQQREWRQSNENCTRDTQGTKKEKPESLPKKK